MEILFVCLGNICRSPTAEGVTRVLAAREAPEIELRLDSAGTAAYHIGEPPDRRSATAALARGYDISGLRARQVTREDFARFDLLLAMDADNLAVLQRRAPAGAARGRIRLFLDFAPGSGRREMPDPYYGGPEAFETVLDLTEQGARGLLAELKGRR